MIFPVALQKLKQNTHNNAKIRLSSVLIKCETLFNQKIEHGNRIIANIVV